MSHVLEHLLDSNKKWAQRIKNDDPSFFSKLTNQQTPRYLWIGCVPPMFDNNILYMT